MHLIFLLLRSTADAVLSLLMIHRNAPQKTGSQGIIHTRLPTEDPVPPLVSLLSVCLIWPLMHQAALIHSGGGKGKKTKHLVN